MDFKRATDRLMPAVTLSDLSAELGMSDATVRQARLDPDSRSYRNPPAGWQRAVAKLARKRGGELVKLAEELEGA
ncbi:MAG: hypothetical protein IH968_06560 [Gemmatimonadetes bacterium]|nr:hypothetical protein [Gemmatimonadota bacterium]